MYNLTRACYNTHMIKTKDTTVDGALDDLASAVGELADEIREWYDNMPPNLQGGEKGQEVEACAEALGSMNLGDTPECVADLVIKVPVSDKKRKSRSDRRSEATAGASAALEAIRDWAEDERAKPDCDDDAAEQAESFADELETVIDEIDAIEFPRAFG